MRKNIQRIIAIVLILFMIMPSAVMAESNILIDYTQNGSEVLISIKGVRNRPVSITIKDEDRYYYADQGITNDLGKIEFRVALETDKTYDCQVNIDGSMASEKIIMEKDTPGTDPKDEKVDLYIKGSSFRN